MTGGPAWKPTSRATNTAWGWRSFANTCCLHEILVVLLVELAHNILLWARQWLAEHAPRLQQYGIVRLIQQVWAIPGRIKLTDKGIQRVRLRGAHPRARDVCSGFRPLLATSHLEVVLD